MNTLAKVVIAAMVAVLALPGQAAAQAMTQAQVDNIVGQAMDSQNGGEYTSLAEGQAVGSRDTILVSSDSQVVLNVTDGTNSWKVTLGPGTHRITPALLASNAPAGAAVGSPSGASVTFTVATILGTAALAAAALDSMDDVPASNPLSL